MGQLVDVPVLEMLPAGEHAAKQDRRIDRRDLRVPDPLAGVDIGEVIEEAAMRGQLVPEKESVSTTRARASARLTKPRFSPMQMAVRPKPVDAMLAARLVSLVRTLQRSLISPVCGLACSQKNRKLACSSRSGTGHLRARGGGRRRRSRARVLFRLLREERHPGMCDGKGEGQMRHITQQFAPRLRATVRFDLFASVHLKN